MNKPKFILADTDETYLISLELKFVEKLGDKADIVVITDRSYFTKHFSTPQSASVLIVSENLYYNELQKQNIESVYVLSEDAEDGGTEDLGVTRIFKYTNTNEIYSRVIATSGAFGRYEDCTKDTQVVLFYSASGGVGKTTLSMATAYCLAKSFKKVLYINAHRLNSFQFYLNNPSPLPNSIYTELMNDDANLFGRIQYVIRNEGFDYLPPFATSLSSVNVSFGIYLSIIQSAKATKNYDVIIVDADNTFDYEKAELITSADKVVIVTAQSKASVNATNVLSRNMSFSDTDKYIFVCNKFQPDSPNMLVDNAKLKPAFTVSEYIKFIPDIDNLDLCDVCNNVDIKKIPYLVM